MPQISLAAGILLILNGLAGFILTGSTHYTALIPAVFGILLAVCGWLALNPLYLKHAMHSAATLTLLGIFGSIKGLYQLPHLLAGHPVARPPAVIAQSIMSLICLGFLGLAVGSFIQARRNRRAEAKS